MDGIRKNFFVTSHNVSPHPLMRARKKTKQLYYIVLEYFVNSCTLDTEYANGLLSQYRTLFVGDEHPLVMTDANRESYIRMLVDDFLKPWRREHLIMLMCDIALIVSDKVAITKAHSMIAKYLSHNKQEKLNELIKVLNSEGEIPPLFANAEVLINQFRTNRTFVLKKEMRIMVTANMSAGKSTLINAIIGKPLTRTSLEACTANLCFLYNKPFEDERVHLFASPLNINATFSDLDNTDKDEVSNIASYFTALTRTQPRICLIDTPGVNFATYKNHGELTRKAIKEEEYDKLIYVLNASLLGTDDEIKHLKFVCENVPNEKVIFALNKLDCFNKADDSITSSIEGVKQDLLKIGFENPIICPLSAYFSLLLKMKQNNEELSEDEQDVYDMYVKKFGKPEYDLSAHYDDNIVSRPQNDDYLTQMCSISGLYGLENILYGGASK